MATIERIFRSVQNSFSVHQEPLALSTSLQKHEGVFLSVAYEAASFCIAVDELKKGTELNEWHDFMKQYASPHAAQFHVGLGWALSQHQLNPSGILQQISTAHHDRVLDGMGYYDGLFRRRKSILQKVIPNYIPTILASGYDQGIGRQIWYSTKGNIDEASSLIKSFSPERQNSLWRGLGVAVAYAGGCDEAILLKIKIQADQNHGALKVGAEKAKQSRIKSGCLTKDIHLITSVWN